MAAFPTDKELQDIEEELRKLKLTKVQQIMIREQSDKIAEVLGIPNLPIRGLWNFSLIEWQKNIKMTTAETETKMVSDKEARVQQTMEIIEIFKEKIRPLLIRKNKEDLLEKALDAMLELYVEKYASRPPDEE